MSTATDIIVAALARSAKNQSDDLAVRGTELLALLNRSLRGCYSVAARVNPEYIGAIVPIVGVAGAWARPVNAEMIWWVETAAGAAVDVVPPAERTAGAGRPSIYRLGRSYVTVGGAGDPGPTATLSFYIAQRPAALALVADPLPASWDTAYDDLLICDLALYLAIKDSRMEEIGPLRAERTSWLQLYVNFLVHETSNLTRRFMLPAAPTLNELNNLLLSP